MQKHYYDVVIMGAGLAALTLAKQIIEKRPDLTLAVVTRSDFPLPEFTTKVGESTVEIGAFYLKEIVGLRDNLEKYHLEKMGLRFIQTDKNSEYYNENGVDYFPYHRCYQIDRGKLENDLYEILKKKVTFYRNSHIQEVDTKRFDHKVTFRQQQQQHQITANWLVDASGRGRILAKKFGLTQKSPLTHSAVWFRVDARIDINKIYSPENGGFCHQDRRRSTTHIVGEGYWVWLIPLRENKTSVGIVIDETCHAFKDIASQEKALDWLKKHEVKLYSALHKCRFLDLKALRFYSYLTKYVYSLDGWFLAGEAAGFVDPLYSNGTDVIGINNTIISNLITGGRKDFEKKVEIYNKFMNSIYDILTNTHINSYKNFHNWYYVFVKTNWDAIFYFLIFCPLFMNRKIEDYEFLKKNFDHYMEVSKKHIEVCEFLRSEKFNEKNYSAKRFVNIANSVEGEINRSIIGDDGNEYHELFNINCDYLKYLANYLLDGGDFNIVFHNKEEFLTKRRAYPVVLVDRDLPTPGPVG